MTTAPSETDPAPAPRLIDSATPDSPAGVVLVLHGGGGRGTTPVSAAQLSVLRMVPIARRIAHAGHGTLAVLRLLNATRGVGVRPLANVEWALDQLRTRYPGLPVSLVGHSLGGSVALGAAGHDGVASVVALAPWLGGSEPVAQLRGRATLIAHGTRDRVTSSAASHDLAARARRAGAAVSYVAIERGEHTMLRRMPAFDLLAARFVHATLDVDHVGRARSGYRGRLDRLALAARDEPGEYAI
ncbi:alpha/beta hydrolase [uncultured Jatrophihabitans sp.]|uniref:alpha/beta hydrolase n=1 Tax=uncultured Jatrophihabitans sp. TaxID=1610747 RepID=UPI0035CAD48D